jgi:hypothetical protein
MKKIKTPLKQLEDALYAIAMMGYGMRDEVRDWPNIGKNAVFVAIEALTDKCHVCNHPKQFKPRKSK